MKMHDTVICLKELLGHYFRDVKEGAVTVGSILDLSIDFRCDSLSKDCTAVLAGPALS